jgi:hypothetical protein
MPNKRKGPLWLRQMHGAFAPLFSFLANSTGLTRRGKRSYATGYSLPERNTSNTQRISHLTMNFLGGSRTPSRSSSLNSNFSSTYDSRPFSSEDVKWLQNINWTKDRDQKDWEELSKQLAHFWKRFADDSGNHYQMPKGSRQWGCGDWLKYTQSADSPKWDQPASRQAPTVASRSAQPHWSSNLQQQGMPCRSDRECSLRSTCV